MTTPPTVLVVEDNALNLKLVRDVLEHAGYTVLVAASGEEGVDVATSGGPDLVLMDLQLPGIDGVEALHRLRGDSAVADVPVVAVTAFAMAEDRARAYAEGFDGYLAKPISVRSLPTQVAGFLRGERDG
jgi:two-component system, cell cycle response regulator DivK